MNKLLSYTLLIILIGGFTLAGTTRFTVQADTAVSGIITSDTTWTKANSPYSLTGPVAVGEGVTLTIEPGVIVNLYNFHNILVNGTLVARGSDNDKIQFNYGSIEFTSVSDNWNEQTGKGSIIENAIINCDKIIIKDVSPKISYNTIYCHIEINGDWSSWYSGRTDSDSSPCSPIISNNNIIGGSKTTPHTIYSDYQCAPRIVNNSLTSMRIACKNAVISNNVINGEGIVASNSYIYNNIISDCSDFGISASGGTMIVCNFISNCYTGIWIDTYDVVTQNNTVVNNQIGIYVDEAGGWLNSTSYNNIYDNSDYNIKLSVYATGNYNLTNNWWGTTDPQVIKQSIYDAEDYFNLGTVNFTPFLTEPNPNSPQTPTSASTPSPAQTTPREQTPTPTQTPQQTESTIIIGAAIVVAVLSAGLGLLIYLIKRK